MEPQQNEQLKRWGGRLLLVLLLVGVGGLIYRASTQTMGVHKAATPPTLVAVMPPPPPPPPEPPKPEEPPPEPDKQVPTDQPKPADAPAPTPQLTISGPAQAGGDAFGIQAGTGGGMSLGGTPGGTGVGSGPVAGGFGESAYRRLMAAEIQQAVQSDERLSKLVFQAEIAIALDSGGRLTTASILKSSGDANLDRNLIAAVQRVGRVSEPPPAGLRFPQQVRVRGRRAA
jgi:protein TonB